MQKRGIKIQALCRSPPSTHRVDSCCWVPHLPSFSAPADRGRQHSFLKFGLRHHGKSQISTCVGYYRIRWGLFDWEVRMQPHQLTEKIAPLFRPPFSVNSLPYVMHCMPFLSYTVHHWWWIKSSFPSFLLFEPQKILATWAISNPSWKVKQTTQ